jgi:hypothetical protein
VRFTFNTKKLTLQEHALASEGVILQTMAEHRNKIKDHNRYQKQQHKLARQQDR